VTDSWSLLKQDERWLIRYDAWKTGVLSEALLTHLLASHTEQKPSGTIYVNVTPAVWKVVNRSLSVVLAIPARWSVFSSLART
ncbi:hypothetical protein WMC73_24245, partial [Citrobacter braakii]